MDARHGRSAGFERLTSAAFIVTKPLDRIYNSHGEARALRARLEPRATRKPISDAMRWALLPCV